MPEKSGHDIPPLHEIESHSLVSSHVDFISYSNTPEERKKEIKGQFESNFSTLPSERQDGIRNMLDGITSDIQELPKLHPGVSFVRNNLICDRIIDLLGECGVVSSVVPGGVERFKEKVIPESQAVLAELKYIDDRIKKERKSRHMTVKTGNNLTNIGAAIREEMTRLGLIPEDLGTKNVPSIDGDLAKTRSLEMLKLNLQISLPDQLIGFSRLDELTTTFLQGLRAARQTEDFYL